MSHNYISLDRAYNSHFSIIYYIHQHLVMSQPLHEQFQNTIDYESDVSQDIIGSDRSNYPGGQTDRRTDGSNATSQSPNGRPPSTGIELKNGQRSTYPAPPCPIPKCRCGTYMTPLVSKTILNPGRLFWRCSMANKCETHFWVDEMPLMLKWLLDYPENACYNPYYQVRRSEVERIQNELKPRAKK
jgi:hypothetical protein